MTDPIDPLTSRLQAKVDRLSQLRQADRGAMKQRIAALNEEIAAPTAATEEDERVGD